MPSEQGIEEYETTTEENSNVAKTGFVDGRIVASVIIIIFLGIVIGLYGPQIWSTLKGIKSKIQDKITYVHEKYPVSKYDNPYSEEPIEY